ncbi:metallophosphoesterase family protein [Paenibacillus albiflavus]|uniref:Metallophosphoesterase family protein n=1 Tax=Paenibacillus albiflavus TaxID=2545760 RepID=A0A4R4ENS2_9BACL|nr:metallophosphoesterase family protein [Paenibacillus albiflavus]TCZ80191.1 metallophosphoesterase family protein [Paenibacillus albiflavus]
MLTIIKGPYLQWPTINSITIMWETDIPSSSKVEIYLAERIHSGYQGNYKKPEYIVTAVCDESFRNIHSITIEHLLPGTTYFYKIYSENDKSEVEAGPYPLKTAVGRGVPFSFTVTSETGGYSGFDQTNGQLNVDLFAQMQRYRPDFTLFVGDVVNDGKEYADWDKYFFGPGRDFMRTTPFYSCLGNHENYASWYYEFMGFAPPKNYYSFDYGDVHFTCLDSTDFVKKDSYPFSQDELRPGNPQYDFLIRDLQAATAKWKIVYFHYPPYVSGGYQVEVLRQLCPILEEYEVDLVFNSHTIVYERSHPIRAGEIDFDKGIVYIVSGGAGAMPDWLLPKRDWHTSQSLAVPHFVQVVVTLEQLEVRAIDLEGRLFDTMQIRKNADGVKMIL